MGNHAAAKKIIELAHGPFDLGRLSDDEIRHLVDSFYAKIRADSELGPIFDRAIPGDWGPHLATMHDFWSSIMLTSGRYQGQPRRDPSPCGRNRAAAVRALAGPIR